MIIEEAIKILQPPFAISKFLLETKYIKCDADKVLLCNSHDWLVSERNKVVENYKRNERYLTNYIKYKEKQTLALKEGFALLKHQAKEAMNKFYDAGYYGARLDIFEVTEKERQDVHSRDTALDALSKHLKDLEYTFPIDEKGNVRIKI